MMPPAKRDAHRLVCIRVMLLKHLFCNGYLCFGAKK
jgi:hypothetical protein